jgi:AraC-like DNA-binding protein
MEKESSFPYFTYNCFKFPDCGWIAVDHVPEAVIRKEAREVTVEVEYFWLNPGRDGWIIIRSNGRNGAEQIDGNDINTNKEFFKSYEWSIWKLDLKDAHFGTRSDGTDLLIYFGADPNDIDICYIRSVKVYETATPDNYAIFGAADFQTGTNLEINICNREQGCIPFDVTCPTDETSHDLPHWQSEMEVIYGQTDGSIIIDGNQIPYHANDIIFINPDQIRTIDPDVITSFHYLVFDLAMLENHYYNSIITDIRLKKTRLINIVQKDHPAHDALRHICRELILMYSTTSPYGEMKIQSLLLDLFYICCEEKLIDHNYKNSTSKKTDYIRNAISYMKANLASPLTIHDIADSIHLSEAYFSRYFKTCIGSTPLEHLNNMRIDKATELLLNGRNVTDAAFDVGIPNVGHFIRLFKKRYGKTPYQWQKYRNLQ